MSRCSLSFVIRDYVDQLKISMHAIETHRLKGSYDKMEQERHRYNCLVDAMIRVTLLKQRRSMQRKQEELNQQEEPTQEQELPSNPWPWLVGLVAIAVLAALIGAVGKVTQ